MNSLLKKARRGFTLVEIMIVVLIIGILLAIAIPNFLKAREGSRGKACQGNLKQIQGAKEQAAMDLSLASTATPTDAQLYGATQYVKKKPVCPSAGTYTTGDMSTNPVCSTGANGTAGDKSDDHILAEDN